MNKVFSYILVVLLLMGILVANASGEEEKLLTVTFIDVGMGDCIFLSYDGENMLIDGGVQNQAYRIKNYFESIGITKLDYMMSTHHHDDHLGGLYKLLSRYDFPVNKFLSPYEEGSDIDPLQETVYQVIQEKEIEYVQIYGGDELYLGGDVSIQFFKNDLLIGTNNRSVVTLVTFGSTRILLMADVCREGQDYLLEKYGPDVFKADILKYAHHGLTSMSEKFMDAVSPAFVVVTNNKTSAKDCERQLFYRDIKRLYTHSGTVVITLDGTIFDFERDVRQLPVDY